MKKIIGLGLMALMVIASSASATDFRRPGRERVQLLATERLADAGENTFVNIHSCRHGYRVHALKIRVLENPARLDRVVVRFGNDEVQSLNIRDHFSVGSETRWVDLHRDGRCVPGVRVVGESLSPGRGTSIVQIWGVVSNN